MIIKKAEIENILSIKEATVEFDISGLILLEGFNYDDNRGNGSGKTAILNAISFALYDKLPRKISKADIKRDGTKTASSYVEVGVGMDIYAVKRYRPTKVEFFKNGEKIDIQQDEFEKRIGRTYEQFLITSYAAQGKDDTRFLSLNDKSKKDFILELMNLNELTNYFKKCKELIKELESKNEILKAELRGLEYNVNTLKESIGDEDGLKEIISANNIKMEELRALATELSTTERPGTEKYDKIREKAREERTKINAFKTSRITLAHERYTLTNSKPVVKDIRPTAECPSCSSPLFNLNGKLVENTDMENLKKETIKLNKEIDEEVAGLSSKISDLDVKIAKEQQIDQLLSQVDQKERGSLVTYNQAVLKIAQLDTQINAIKNINSTYESKIANNDNVRKRLKETLTKAAKLVSQIDTNNKEKDVTSTISSIFATTGAAAHVMEEFVSNFNDMIRDNISLIWGNASYYLQTHKVNSDKKITAKFSEQLIINAKDKSIGSLSGGEYKSLSLAADFAILDVLEKQFGVNLSPIFLDEPFDGLDPIGREMVIELLVSLSKKRQIWVVDHASEAKTLFSKVVRIEKRNGISKLV